MRVRLLQWLDQFLAPIIEARIQDALDRCGLADVASGGEPEDLEESTPIPAPALGEWSRDLWIRNRLRENLCQGEDRDFRIGPPQPGEFELRVELEGAGYVGIYKRLPEPGGSTA